VVAQRTCTRHPSCNPAPRACTPCCLHRLGGSSEWGGESLASSGSGAVDSVCYLQAGGVQGSAKSFSFAAQRKHELEQAERRQAAAQQSAWAASPSIKADSITQFSQKVELYRGRCVVVVAAGSPVWCLSSTRVRAGRTRAPARCTLSSACVT
jgi:hypothetical protein